MAKLFIEDSSLAAIGDAIRMKTGSTEKMSPAAMAETIGEMSNLTSIIISGNCNYRFYGGGWNWVVNVHGDKIETMGITKARSMFEGCSFNDISFDLNFDSSSAADCESMFHSNIKGISGVIRNLTVSGVNNMFSAPYLRYLPEFENFSVSGLMEYAHNSSDHMFYNCTSLREIPESFLKKLTTTSSNYPFVYYFSSLYCLDEVRGVSPITGTLTSDKLCWAFANFYRAKEIVFDVQEDGAPYEVNWRSQTIDLSKYIGYASDDYSILNYNSGITEDKRLNASTYESLKDDPDSYALSQAYSRYNHDSAVNTINSLPDTSAYLASLSSTYTNTIKFKGASGSATDGGAINTLTEEEIAVATAKGWTVSYV